MAHKKNIGIQLFGIILLLVLLVGIGVAVYLSKTSQDTRQRASEAGIVDVTLSPQTSTYTSTDQATVQVMVDSGPNIVKVEKLQFTIANISGDIPNDLSFTLAPIPGVIKITTALIDTATGKRLDATLSNPSNSYSTNGETLPMGSFRFTPKSSGSMNIVFDPSFAQTFKGIQGNEIIRLGGAGDYIFSIPSPTPALTITPIPAVTSTLRVQSPQQSSTQLSATSSTPTPVPTPTPTLIAQSLAEVTPAPTSTPTPIPTPTPSPTNTQESLSVTPTATPTPTPNSGKVGSTSLTVDSSSTQEQLPVTGSTQETYLLIYGALISLSLGVGLFLTGEDRIL
jgi:hypothetical protein